MSSLGALQKTASRQADGHSEVPRGDAETDWILHSETTANSPLDFQSEFLSSDAETDWIFHSSRLETTGRHIDQIWEDLPIPNEQTGYIITPAMVDNVEDMLRDGLLNIRADTKELDYILLNLTSKPRIAMILKSLGVRKPPTKDTLPAFFELSGDYLPLSKEDLKSCFPEPLASRFFQRQYSALARDLPKGAHLDLNPLEYPPFLHKKNLGRGAFGSVDLVENVFTHDLFARKTLHAYQHRARAHAEFTREVAHLRKLGSHHHIVEFAGSYVQGKDLCLLILPVAEYSLLDLFSDPQAFDSLDHLYRLFGCLITGLDYMHEKQIRHKDIKPGNILVHGEKFMFTDFGLAFDFSELEQSTTSGRPDAMTKKYCPVEVLEHGSRGRSADIFSLGCVFVQALTILAGLSLDDLDDFLAGNEDASHDGIFCYNLRKVNEWLGRINSHGTQSTICAAEWCTYMLRYERTERWDAHALSFYIWHISIIRCQLEYNFIPPHTFFCTECAVR